MSTLTNKTVASTYKDLLQISNSNNGIDNTIRYIEDGEGTLSKLGLSDTGITIGTDLLPSDDDTHSIGSSTAKIQQLYTGDQGVNVGAASVSADGSVIVIPKGSKLGTSPIVSQDVEVLISDASDTSIGLNTLVTELIVDDATHGFKLPNGNYSGQMKIITTKDLTNGEANVTPDTAPSYTTISFKRDTSDSATLSGQGVTLVYTSVGWIIAGKSTEDTDYVHIT